MNVSAVIRPAVLVAMLVALLALLAAVLLPTVGIGGTSSARVHTPAVSFQAGNWCC